MVTVISSPADVVSSCSSKVPTRRPEPSSIIWSRPSPPANGSPSTEPRKSITTKSPFWAGRSTVSRRPLRSRRRSISSSIAASSTSPEGFSTSRPLYSPRVALGRTPISIEKVSGWPCSGRPPRSRFGSPTGAIRASSMAAEYQAGRWSRTVSSRTASRPMRWMTIGAGALPGRNPGTRRSRPSERADCATRFSTSSAVTSASTRTRDSGSSVTLVETPLVAISGWTIASGAVRSHERFAAWLVTGPVGHLVAGVTDLAVLFYRLSVRASRPDAPPPRS